MAKQQNYYELLRHPNWQRKRLEIMDEAGFTCQSCGAEESTLNIHHGYYEKGMKPWEYPDDTLRCVCETCHFRLQTLLTEVYRCIGRLDEYSLSKLHGFVQALAIFQDSDRSEESLKVCEHPCAEGIGEAYGLTDDEVIDLAINHRDDDYQVPHRELADLARALARKDWREEIDFPLGFHRKTAQSKD